MQGDAGERADTDPLRVGVSVPGGHILRDVIRRRPDHLSSWW